jgi:hypothetical protein
MQKQWILVILLLSIVSLASASLFAQGEEPPSPPLQGGAPPRQMRGPDLLSPVLATIPTI